MNRWWANLSRRERWFVSSGSYVAVVVTLFLLLVVPVHSDLTAARKRLEREAAVTAELEAKAGEARALRSRAETPLDRTSGQSLFALINASAGEAGVRKTIVRVTPRGKDEAALVIENAVFDELAAWLVVIASDFDIEVSQATVERQGVPGIVSGNLTLAFTPTGSYRRSGAGSRSR